MSDPSPAPPPSVACPHCGGALEASPGEKPQVVTCPYCDQPFILPGSDGSSLPVARRTAAVEDEPPGFVTDDVGEAQRARDDLDQLHVRKVSAIRRSAYRTRSWMLIGLAMCVVGAIQLAIFAFYEKVPNVGLARRAFSNYSAAYLMIAAVLLALGWRLWARAAELKREAERTQLPPPAAPPDLSNLSDGSQRYRNLEKLKEDDDESGRN